MENKTQMGQPQFLNKGEMILKIILCGGFQEKRRGSTSEGLYSIPGQTRIMISKARKETKGERNRDKHLKEKEKRKRNK